MVNLSRSEIIKSHPIGSRLDGFQSNYTSGWKNKVDSNIDCDGKFHLHTCEKKLLMRCPHSTAKKDLLNDLASLYLSTVSNSFDNARVEPLLDAVLNKQPNEVIWDAVYNAVAESTPPPTPASSIPLIVQTLWRYSTSGIANSTEHRKYMDGVLKEELGPMYVRVPGFFEAFFFGEIASLQSTAQAVFEMCKARDNPFYLEESGWQGWPEGAKEKEKDVLRWFAELTDQTRAQRRPLVQPHQPLQGSTADRKLDIGFVDDLNAGVDSKYYWKQIHIPGELKSNPLADIASEAWLDLGRYAREVLAAQDSRRFVLGSTLCGSRMRLWLFDIHENGLQFVSTLGFDPTIITKEGKRYIKIEQNGYTERLIIDEIMKRLPCITGRATTCWKAYREGDDLRIPLVIKDSWQFPEREEEGELLREAANKNVVNVARYYYHRTVCVGGKDDDIHGNVQQGLESSIPPSSTAGRRISRTGRSSSVGRKRSSSCTDAPLPPSKRTFHRHIIVRDYGKPIYTASSPIKLLAALESCIEGYELLHTRASMLECDISPNNLMINEDKENPSWPVFIIDLDLAIKEQREKSSRARAKTGSRAFMAIGVLLDDENHSFMHDLESIAKRFDKWNYVDTEELAEIKKGIIGDERDFLKMIESTFTPYYQPLASFANRLRRKVFPDGRRWRDPNLKLYSEMREILQVAQRALKDSNSTIC
ncbi:hypothetical protein GQ44DRAFT_743041 [Phaeosphaeriaceae sp. PMI808]|nr:hypothetical protein GQ44DRAFT_743041 [Phaeosphaeriaceae sp. PMI808]